MLCMKKLYREELLQLALLLSLLRVDPNSYFGLDIQTIGVGSLDLNNGSGWHMDHTIIHRPMFIHPKNPDSMLLNYQRDLFEELNSLGRYNRMNSGLNAIQAYLLNVEESNRVAGPSVPVSTNTTRNMTSPDPPTSIQSPADPVGAAELTQEDMDLIEVLWKQDVDLGFTLVEPTTAPTKKPSTSEKESADEIEKLKALEAINATYQKNDTKESEPQEDDPWAGLPYTVDLETGEYILSSGSQNGSRSSIVEEDDPLLNEASLALDNHPLADLTDDSLGLNDTLGLEHDFTSELLGGSLLESAGVEGLLSNDTLGLPDEFNLEEALQLVGLDEAQPEETKSEVKKKKKEDTAEDSASAEGDAAITASSNAEVVKSSSRCEDPETGDMIHTPQFHHPHHPHHRSFQGRMPFMRAMSMEQRWQDLASLLSLPGAPDHFAHPAHPGYPGHGISHSHYEAQRNVLLHNPTLAPPVGDLNSTGPYHNVGGSSNLGSAVATSMNLTNSSEPMGAESGASYKSEPNDMMYYHTPTTDSINQTTDGFLSSLLNDEDLHLMDMAMNDGKRKVHFLMEDGREMVEEYSTDTNVVVRRAWKQKNGFGTNIGWMVEVGDPEFKQNNIEIYGIEESSNTPIITRRITKASLEWRIRNLPYPENVYSVTAEHDGTMTIRTSNKKYFKKIKIPDLERIGLKPKQERISFRHQYNTLIITYKKPPQLLDMEKKILAAVLQLKTDSKDVQCPTS